MLKYVNSGAPERLFPAKHVAPVTIQIETSVTFGEQTLQHM